VADSGFTTIDGSDTSCCTECAYDYNAGTNVLQCYRTVSDSWFIHTDGLCYTCGDDMANCERCSQADFESPAVCTKCALGFYLDVAGDAALQTCSDCAVDVAAECSSCVYDADLDAARCLTVNTLTKYILDTDGTVNDCNTDWLGHDGTTACCQTCTN